MSWWRIEFMENTPKLNEAISKAQAEFKAVAFDATNPFLKNKYASLGACIESTKAVLAKHGLSVTQQPTGDGSKIGVVTTLRHASGESVTSEIALPLSDEKGKSQAQLAGSIITYLRRYSLAGVLGLYADEDTDGHATPTAPAPVTTTTQGYAPTFTARNSPSTPSASVSKPDKPAKAYTPKDRVKFIAAMLKNSFAPEEIQEYALKASIILPTERFDQDWPLTRIPQTAKEFAALMESIKGFVTDGDNVP
jgi:hypothetical protein